MICQDFTTDVKRPNPLIMGEGNSPKHFPHFTQPGGDV
jgi:hypothetical protein